jgi:hypothetical protein
MHVVQVGCLAVRQGLHFVKRALRTGANGCNAVMAGGLEQLQSVQGLSLVQKWELVTSVGYGAAYTLEFVLFPFLFPKGRGFFRAGRYGFRTLTSYLKHRMHQFFSCFTLYKLFLLMMYQLQQADRLSRKVGAARCVCCRGRKCEILMVCACSLVQYSQVVLQKHVRQYLKRHPGKSSKHSQRA